MGNPVRNTASLVARAAVARGVQALGWTGALGIGLLLASMVIAGTSWREKNAPLPRTEATVPSTPVQAAPAAATVPPLALPGAAEVPLLLTQIQVAATSQGLGWPAADYKLSPATETLPAALEVRCSFKGPYPKVRAMLSQILSDVPGLAIRDLVISRASSETAEVEAKMVLLVFLQDQSTSASQATVDGRGAR